MVCRALCPKISHWKKWFSFCVFNMWDFTSFPVLQCEKHTIQTGKKDYWWFSVTLKMSLMHNNKSVQLFHSRSTWRLNREAKGLSVGYSHSTPGGTMTTLMTMSLSCERRANTHGRLSAFPPVHLFQWELFQILLSSNQWRFCKKELTLSKL